MPAPSHSPGRPAEACATAFRFVSIQTPDDPKNPVTRRLARSHAVKQGLQRKRNLEWESSDNFRVSTSQNKPQKLTGKKSKSCVGTITVSLSSLSAGKLDPFQTLAVNSSRLQTLLCDHKARQAPEPVFSVAEELAFQSFRSVFRTGLHDAALLCAVMLSLSFAAAGGSINRECLGYRGRTISHVREKMSSPNEATSEATIGAILLLAGVEASLGMTSQVQLHMGAVRHLLDICRTKGVYLTCGIKRAIFWQDLNASILTGSTRIVDHSTFSELRWERDPSSPSYFRLPPGFQTRSSLLGQEFSEILEDLHALQCIRNYSPPSTCNTMLMAHINNHIASIQSRLVGLPDLSPAMSCCRSAAYLCSVMLCCRVWCGLVVPSYLSSQLLRELQQANNDPVWDDHPDLLLWILFIGGAFAPAGTVRSDYVALLHLNHASRFEDLYGSWLELVDILNRFIWSEKAFMSPVRALWAETFATAGPISPRSESV